MDAGSSQTPCCPGCGRPVRPGRERCMWCGADCSGLTQTETHPRCPVCRADLGKHTGGEWTVHLCGAGHGIWMTTAVLERFERFHESVRPQSGKGAKADGADGAGPDERKSASMSDPHPPVLPEGAQDATVEYRPCPECGQSTPIFASGDTPGFQGVTCSRGRGVFLRARGWIASRDRGRLGQ